MCSPSWTLLPPPSPHHPPHWMLGAGALGRPTELGFKYYFFFDLYTEVLLSRVYYFLIRGLCGCYDCCDLAIITDKYWTLRAACWTVVDLRVQQGHCKSIRHTELFLRDRWLWLLLFLIFIHLLPSCLFLLAFIPYRSSQSSHFPDFTFPMVYPSLYLITMVICTNLVSFLQHSVSTHFPRILKDTTSLISVLLFCLHAKRILHHYTILMKYDRIFASYFGLHRFNVHSIHLSTWGVYCLVTFLDLQYLPLLMTLHLRLKISLEHWLKWALRPQEWFCFSQLHLGLIYPRLGLSCHIHCLAWGKAVITVFQLNKRKEASFFKAYNYTLILTTSTIIGPLLYAYLCWILKACLSNFWITIPIWYCLGLKIIWVMTTWKKY